MCFYTFIGLPFRSLDRSVGFDTKRFIEHDSMCLRKLQKIKKKTTCVVCYLHFTAASAIF